MIFANNFTFNLFYSDMGRRLSFDKANKQEENDCKTNGRILFKVII